MRSIMMPDMFSLLQLAGLPVFGKEDGFDVDLDASEIRWHEI